MTRPDRSDRKELALQMANGVVTPTVRISRPPRLSIEYIKKAQAQDRETSEWRWRLEHPDADDKMATRTLNINGARWHQVKEQASCMSLVDSLVVITSRPHSGIMSGSDQFHPWQFQAWNELDSNLGESERAVARKERALIWVPPKAVPSVLYHYHEEGVHGKPQAMIKNMLLRWYWPSMKRDTVKWQGSCADCLRSRARLNKRILSLGIKRYSESRIAYMDVKVISKESRSL